MEFDPFWERVLWFSMLAAGAVILWRVMTRRYPRD